MRKIVDVKGECLSCVRCPIGGCDVGGKISNVFSNMNHSAKIMVVGQNPGKTEVEQGLPFVGQSGAFFDAAVKKVLCCGREAFYVTNTVKCFTPGNRHPSAKEVESCRCFLDEEIRLLKPNLVITLGAPALEQVSGYSSITKHHGKILKSIRYMVDVLPLWHPSPLNMNSQEKRDQFFEDLKMVKPYLCLTE